MVQSDSQSRVRVMHVQDKCGHGGSQIQGVQRLLLWWWPAFKDSEFELSLCILRNRNEASKGFDKAGVPVSYLDRSRFDPRTLLDLIVLIRKKRIQILHCHGYGSTTFGRLAGALTGTPVIVHEHMVDSDIPFYQRFIDRLFSPLTNKGIAVSNAVREFMTGARFISEEKIEVIYNGVPVNYCNKLANTQKTEIAASLNVDESQPAIGIIGRLHPVKGHADFLAAAAKVLDVLPSAQFLVVGDGDLMAQLEKQAGLLGIRDNVYFLGHRDDVFEIIAILDVLVISSHSEGCPLSLLEAMAAEKTIVSTAVGGIPEMLLDGESALLVLPADPQRLADAIINVLEDRELGERLSNNAYNECREKYLISKTVARFSEMYRSLVRV